MTVEFEVTEPQALTLQAMFEEWNYLSNIGASRHVSFFVDGDGNFHPKCKINYDQNITKLTEEMKEIAKFRTNLYFDIGYDFDKIAWYMRDNSNPLEENINE